MSPAGHRLLPRRLAYTRYSFTCFCVWQESIIPLLPLPILYYPHYCNTIARLMRNI